MPDCTIELSPRLVAISEITPPCSCFADIGTDHAYLPVYLCQSGICKRAVASDIVKGPVEHAQSTVSKYNLNDRISVRMGNGLSSIKEGEADVICIAGMGGLVISEILKNGRKITDNAKAVILQPMTAVSDLRKFLYNNGFCITSEYLAEDNGKIYNILSVKAADNEVLEAPSEGELFLGKHLIENKPPLFEKYLIQKINKLSVAISGLKKSCSTVTQDKLKIYTELYNELIKIKGE